MGLESVFSSVAALFFPPRCIFCGGVVSLSESVCEECRAKTPPAPAVRRIFVQSAGRIISCAVPFSYEGLVRQGILRFKFHGRKEAAGFFGAEIAREFPRAASHFDWITAVPLSVQRLKKRGYNQSELVARAAARILGLPYLECLEKTRDNREQHRLTEKERKRNVRSVYRAGNPEEISGKRILLIDDIITTGATLSACASALFQAGAAEVSAAAIARVGTESVEMRRMM